MNILSPADIVSCVSRTLRGSVPITRTVVYIIRYDLRRTEEAVSRGGTQEDGLWVFANRVTAAPAAVHPLAALCTALQDVMALASNCIACDAVTVSHYCRSCLVACYCSSDCQQEHWAAGHMAECGDVVARLHGTAGLQPPLADINPELQAMRMRASRAQDRAHHTMCLLMGALGQVEQEQDKKLKITEQCRAKDEMLKEKDEENARLSRIT
jgi:hypothetical protein